MILIWIFISVFAFASTSFFRQYRDVDTLILVAIGTAINANIYNAITLPSPAFGMTFGIDSILYTLFVFTVYLRAKDYSVNDAKSMAITTIQAILVSAVIEFFARFLQSGKISSDLLIIFSNYVISSISSLLCLWLMFGVMKKFSALNKYILTFVCILGTVWINSLFYYLPTLFFATEISSVNIGFLFGSLLGKLVCSAIAVFFYFLNQTVWIADSKKNQVD